MGILKVKGRDRCTASIRIRNALDEAAQRWFRKADINDSSADAGEPESTTESFRCKNLPFISDKFLFTLF
jgi:hypothetical protein